MSALPSAQRVGRGELVVVTTTVMMTGVSPALGDHRGAVAQDGPSPRPECPASPPRQADLQAQVDEDEGSEDQEGIEQVDVPAALGLWERSKCQVKLGPSARGRVGWVWGEGLGERKGRGRLLVP